MWSVPGLPLESNQIVPQTTFQHVHQAGGIGLDCTSLSKHILYIIQSIWCVGTPLYFYILLVQVNSDLVHKELYILMRNSDASIPNKYSGPSIIGTLIIDNWNDLKKNISFPLCFVHVLVLIIGTFDNWKMERYFCNTV